jgi:hypothetical protein
MKLRYTGTSTVTFVNSLVGEVVPGQEFNVPDEEAAAYLTRSDVEEVEEVSDPFFVAAPVLPPLVVETVHDEEEEPEAPEVV